MPPTITLAEGWTFTVREVSVFIQQKCKSGRSSWETLELGQRRLVPTQPMTMAQAALCLMLRESPLPESCATCTAALQQWHTAEAWSGRRSLLTDFALSCSRSLGKSGGELPSTSHCVKACRPCSCTVLALTPELVWPHYSLGLALLQSSCYSRWRVWPGACGTTEHVLTTWLSVSVVPLKLVPKCASV